MQTTMDASSRGRAAPDRALTMALAVIGALAPAVLLALIARAALPLAAVPAVTFGVPVMTAPALYVALTLRGGAPPMTDVASALGRGLHALALVQLGLAAPVGFLAATASPATAIDLVAGATMMAVTVAAIALDRALAARTGAAVLWTWMTLTALIAVRLHADVVAGVTP